MGEATLSTWQSSLFILKFCSSRYPSARQCRRQTSLSVIGKPGCLICIGRRRAELRSFYGDGNWRGSAFSPDSSSLPDLIRGHYSHLSLSEEMVTSLGAIAKARLSLTSDERIWYIFTRSSIWFWFLDLTVFAEYR